MRTWIRDWVRVVVLLAIPAAPVAAASVAQLARLAGCWSSEDAEPGSGEQWMQPAAIEGVRGDRLERIEFPMKRVSCEPAPDYQAGIKVPVRPR